MRHVRVCVLYHCCCIVAIQIDVWLTMIRFHMSSTAIDRSKILHRQDCPKPHRTCSVMNEDKLKDSTWIIVRVLESVPVRVRMSSHPDKIRRR